MLNSLIQKVNEGEVQVATCPILQSLYCLIHFPKKLPQRKLKLSNTTNPNGRKILVSLLPKSTSISVITLNPILIREQTFFNFSSQFLFLFPCPCFPSTLSWSLVSLSLILGRPYSSKRRPKNS